ncbi:uncharacterized protein LOC123524205 [Mercenaria mercenaria]|uniref:uncharacterized protein LOC123524205 n=1 Tax=Mercenaria mercenaria TaxID=6596 RepID=UPI00234F93E7|nr:uncharacterized protein LOC123524205 [Mercenaria mercenaria]XP_045158179.2 uncharacterized protein LOC123524205 [Mercenaria mercenaria]XP_045158180.2 uncharacterized protein LOC123524205 [Mercenaria mercenaria]
MDKTDNGTPEDLRPKQRRRSQNLNTRKGRLSTEVRKREKEKPQKAQQKEDKSSKELQLNNLVVLRVGEEKVNVDKETLIVSSEYFKALFSGHFSDSDAKELDLTKDVEKIEDLRILLDFISNGKVEITKHNLSQVLKVSSFFLVDSLTEKCAKFMSETTSLETCVQHYLIASNYALPKHYTRKFQSLLETRFHDYIIYEEDVASYLNDEELKQLMLSGIMKHCSKESLFNFLLKWLSKSPELTDKQFTLVADIIQYFEQCKTAQTVPFQCEKKKTIANINRMAVALRKSCEPEMLQKFRLLFNNFLRSKEHVFEHLDKHTSVGIFTFSKRTCINRASTKDRNDPSCRFLVSPKRCQELLVGPNETCDLCVYQPDSRVWFHIATFGEDKYFEQVDGRPYQPTTQMRQQHAANIFCDIVVTGEEMMFRDISNKCRLVRYNFKSKRWTNFNIKDIIVAAENMTHFQFEYGRNGVLYLITRNTRQFASHLIEFRGYTFDLTGLALQPIFSTEGILERRGESFKEWSHMTVKRSSVSNELIILFTKGVGENLAILVDLGPLENGGKAKSYTLLHKESLDTTKCEELMFVDVDILETDDRFLIVSSANRVLTIKYQYKFHSKVLEFVENGPQYHLSPKCDRHGEKANRSTFRDSYWEMDEEYGFGSHNRKIKFSTFGEPDIEFHTPPPFVDTVSVCVAEVNKNIFSDLEPVKQYL